MRRETLSVVVYRPATKGIEDKTGRYMWTFNAEVDGEFGIIIITSAHDHTEDEAAEAARIFLERDPGSLGGVAFAGDLLDGDDVEEDKAAATETRARSERPATASTPSHLKKRTFRKISKQKIDRWISATKSLIENSLRGIWRAHRRALQRIGRAVAGQSRSPKLGRWIGTASAPLSPIRAAESRMCSTISMGSSWRRRVCVTAGM
jgi:hypothetical protein